MTAKVDTLEEGASDRQGNLDSSVMVYRPDSGDKYPTPMNGLSDVAGDVSSAQKVKRVSSMEANASANLADSVAVSGTHSKGNNMSDSKNRITPNRYVNTSFYGFALFP